MNQKKKRPVDEFPWQEYDRKEFEERFPALSKELESGGISIDAYSVEKAEDEELIDLHNYVPNIFDYLQRCETDEQALEIINWLEERGEIPQELAERLRLQLVEKGVRSFGPKREWGWYEKHGKG